MMETGFNISADLPGYGGMRNLLIVPLKRSYIVMLDGKELCIVWKGRDEHWKELNEKLEMEVTQPIGNEIDSFFIKNFETQLTGIQSQLI
jgi:hypothetical protein